MNGYLLDTSAALIALTDPARLSPRVRAVIRAGPNILSAIVYWEVLLKSMKGLLKIGDPLTWWPEALEQLAATPLVLRPEHIAKIYHLPPIHRDPFDRVLIAQAMVEGLSLVTTDREILRYASKRLRVVSCLRASKAHATARRVRAYPLTVVAGMCAHSGVACASHLPAHLIRSSSSGLTSGAWRRNFARPAPEASPARLLKNSAAVSTTPIFSATAAAIHWLRETPSSAASRWAAFLTEIGSFNGYVALLILSPFPGHPPRVAHTCRR